MKQIVLPILAVLISLAASAFTADPQVYFTQCPIYGQVFPRDTLTNKGTAAISGTVSGQNGYTAITVALSRENVLQKKFTQQLQYENGTAGFSFNVLIKAELADYDIKVYGIQGSAFTLLRSASHLLAGDAFIIQGQSNAEAVLLEGSSNTDNQNTFIRVYGSGGNTWDKTWRIADGDVGGLFNDKGNTGQWGLRLAKRLLDSTHIPVVVFNGAHGGKAISFFHKQGDSTGNYAFLERRVYESGFINNIRAIFWYQGESDANPGNSIETYKESFYQLYNNWKKDYKGFQKLYIVQINQSCGVDLEGTAKIEEAERQLADEIPGAVLFATNGIEHYGAGYCHYAYENGYKLVGDYLFPLLSRDFRGITNVKDIESPQVKRILQTDSNTLTLYFRNEQDSYIWEAGTEKDFVLNGIPAKVASGIVNGSTLVLTLNKKIKVDSLSFYGHAVGGSPCIRNLSGAGIAGFYKFPVGTASLFSQANAVVPGSFPIKITVYPVPSPDVVTAAYDLPENSPLTIYITDVTGKKVRVINAGYYAAGNNQSTINISSLQKGIYFLVLQTNRFTSSIKIVKQ